MKSRLQKPGFQQNRSLTLEFTISTLTRQNTNFYMGNTLHFKIFRKKHYTRTSGLAASRITSVFQFYKIILQFSDNLHLNWQKPWQSHWRTMTRISNSLKRFLFLFLLDVSPITSRAGMISLPKCVGIYTKLKLVYWTLDVHHSCFSLLSFTVKNNFLNFVQRKIFPDLEAKQ